MKSPSNRSQICKSFYQKDKLDLDSWFKITKIDYETLIEQYPFEEMLAAFGKKQINLLDIGCGTGKFPSLLDRHIYSDIHLSSDFLDISDFCLQEIQIIFANLKHFSPNKTYLSEIENIDSIIPKTQIYDLIWAIHSLDMLDENKIKSVLQSCCQLLSPNGKFLIYKLSEHSFYYKNYDFYRKSSPKLINNVQPFMTTNKIRETLEYLGLTYKVLQISFDHIVNYNQQDLLEVYLKKCVLNDEIDVLSLFQDWLSQYLDSLSNQYKFPQVVNLFTIQNK